MTLTEQWKKGELEWGKNYYCRNVKTNETNICFLYGSTWYSADSDGEGDIDWQGSLEVLAPVPSYEEWLQLNEVIKRTKASGNYPSKVSQYKARITVLNEENQQLKEKLEKAEATLLDIDGGWVTDEIRSKISEYFVHAIGEKK